MSGNFGGHGKGSSLGGDQQINAMGVLLRRLCFCYCTVDCNGHRLEIFVGNSGCEIQGSITGKKYVFVRGPQRMYLTVIRSSVILRKLAVII